MALIDSLNPAVAGLRIQQKKIEVVGDNIANVDTPSFKTSRVEFSSIFSQVLSFGAAPEGTFGGINPIQIGKGAQLASISKDFTQGAIKNTGIASDLAIDGDGFFVVRSGTGETLYTRDGSFGLSSGNQLIDPATGGVVQGWMADSDFDISVGGPLQDVTIPTGSLSIARATSKVSMQGILNSSGEVASSGSWLFSADLYDNRSAQSNSDLISSKNPLGMNRASRSTPLENLVVSLGDFTTYSASSVGTSGTSSALFPDLQTDPTGLEISFEFSKGDRSIETSTFTVGGPAPNGGTTLGELTDFLEDTFGITGGLVDGVELAEHSYSFQRVSPISQSPVAGTISASDSVSLASITFNNGDLRGVEVGDYFRITSGSASGQIAQITDVTDGDSDNIPDTLTLRADGFNSLSIVPETGDTWVVHAPAELEVAQDKAVTSLRQQTTGGQVADIVVATGPAGGAINTLTLTAATTGAGAAQNFLGTSETFANAHGIQANQIVQWTTSSGTAQGWITGFTDNTITVSWNSSLGAQTPTANSEFSILERPPGSIEIAGNTGSPNNISNVQTLADGDLVSLFTAPPVAQAVGEGVNTTFTVFDSQGSPHEIEMTFVYEAASANGPSVVRYIAESEDDANRSRVIGSGSIAFNAEGQFLGTGRSTETVRLDLQPTVTNTQGVATPLNLEVDFSRLSLLNTTNSAVQLEEQDGFPAGTLREFGVGEDGIITGIFDNGLSRNLGQIALARFQNNNGLVVTGSNYYRQSSNSGNALVGTPGTLGRGNLRGGSLEDSNVNLAEQFTDLITGQRAFQANARTFSASDQLLQELVNLI